MQGSQPEFVGFPKIPRFNREIVITEKIDGTNAQIRITADGQLFPGSRNRWLTLESDNFGFARWCHENREDLLKLGPGSHFGEWWGQGIQRTYGQDRKRFSLFNTGRWQNPELRPACCDAVPVLYRGFIEGDWRLTNPVTAAMMQLAATGSVAAPGFMKPEGIIIYHIAAGVYFKRTFEKDHEPKGVASATD